ncbi:hypothetical protein ACJMK2_009199 [Sinanodonta woodiana]|uniref:SWIM-type domain-containing protein n=1 Tax=Sinanodonta woodiana TaxID=1069815 RepID=A0ABD3VBI4_SINWO
MRITEKPLEPWVIVSGDGIIDSAHCTCMAGLGECCNHVAALLFALETSTRIKKDATVTDAPAYWMLPSNADLSSPYKRLSEMHLESAVKKRKMSTSEKDVVQSSCVKKSNNSSSPTKQEEALFFQDLAGMIPNAAVLSLADQFSNNFVAKSISVEWPVDLGALYDSQISATEFSYDQIRDKCKVVDISITKKSGFVVEQETRNESKSVFWHKNRVGRITASHFHSSCHTNVSKPSVCLLKTICCGDRTKKAFSCAATDWGKKKEKTAKKEYSRHMEMMHKNFKVTQLANVLNQLIHCPMDDFLDSIEEKIFYFLPQILCLLFTTFTYLHTFVLRVIWLWKNRNKKQEHAENTRRKLAQPHQLERVKRLLKGKKLSADGEVNVPDVDNILKIYTYKRDPTFRYSSKIIVTFTVAIICIYQVAIAWIFLTKDVFHWGKQLIKISESSQVDIFMNLLDVAAASSAIGLSLSGIVTLVNATGIFLSYRADIKRLYRGDHSKFLVKREDISASSIVSRNLIYSGTQIAYMLWGFLILYIVFTIIGILLAVFLVLPITGKLDSFFLEPIKVIAPGIAISLILFYLQYQLCHRIFLQKIATESGDGKSNPVLAMDNRKAYHNVSYFLFFFYIFLGLFGCLMNRIGRTVLLGLAFLGRMDRCCLLPGYESFDNGYTSYISFLQLEEAHQHPVIVTFCDLLLDHVHQKSEDSMITYGAIRPNPPARLRTTNNSQRMWLKAYTILQNNLYNQKQENENNVDALSRVKETKETTNVVSENVDSEV